MTRGNPEAVRLTCERYQKAVASGVEPGVIVAEMAADAGVQRPAIWRRLRAGGVLPPYQKRKEGGAGRPLGGGTPGYYAARAQAHLDHALAQKAKIEARRVPDRTPCSFCGVRADYGCRHQQVAA